MVKRGQRILSDKFHEFSPLPPTSQSDNSNNSDQSDNSDRLKPFIYVSKAPDPSASCSSKPRDAALDLTKLHSVTCR